MEDVLGRRIAAALIDVGVALVIVLLVGGIVGNDPPPGAGGSARFGTLDRLLAIGLVLAYYCATELAWAQTLGKRVMKLRVVCADGTKADSGSLLVRNLVRLVDWLPVLYVFGAVVFFASGQRRQRLGDMAARTKVVADDAEPPRRPQPPDRPDDDDVIAQILR